MKKIFILTLLACLLSSMLFAQTIQLIMSPNPSPYFSDWQNKTETARLIVNNTSQTSIDCKIKTQLFNGDDELVAETDFVKMPLLTLMPGISQFNAENIYPLEAVKTYGNSFNSMSSTGRIPDGNYRLCTDLVDPINGTPLTAQSPQCKMFRIIAYQAPVLIAPRENQIIPETEAKGIIFRWTPVAPSPNYIVTYRLQIWEVSDGQTNVDAVRYNWPIIEKDFRGILQTQWPFDFAPPEEGINYVWTITPLDNEERNLVDGYEFADPFGFRFTTGDVNPPLAIIKILQPPPNQLRMTDLWNFTLNNPTRKPLEVSLECKMTTQETHPIVIIIIIHLKPFTLPPGTTTFTYEDIKNGDVKFASDEWRDIILNMGNIPSGDYNICVSAIDKEGKEIGKDCIEQEIASDEACKYLSVDFMEERKIYKGDSTLYVQRKIYTGDSIAYTCTIVNNYKGKEEQNKPKTFRIKANNDLYMSVSESTSRGWKRTPSKFPPGSSEIVWTASSGDIPGGESNLGSILFTNVKSGPISVQYEWLNKDDKVICSGTRTLDMTDLGATQRVKLISPKNGEGINIDNPEFRWLNFKITNDREKFRLRIVEIIGNQSPEEAMQNSESFFDVWGELPSREGEMIYKYPESSPKFEAGKKYAWMVSSGDLQSRINLFECLPKRKIAFRWKTDYRVEHPDILKYLRTQELIIKQGEYPYDYSSNPNGEVILILAKPIPDKGEIDKKGIMVAADSRDPSCLEFGDACISPSKGIANWLVKPVIENGLIIKIILSFGAGSNSSVGNNGDANSNYDVSNADTTQHLTLISPKNGESIRSEQQLQFSWLPPVPVSPDMACRLKIVELKGNEPPEEAMQNVDSFFDVFTELSPDGGIMIYKYPESAPKFEDGKRYAWMIMYGDLRSSISIFDRWGLKSTTLRCDCGTWSPININKVNYDCGGRIDWKCNELINFSSAYQCIPNDTACKAETSWEITRNGQAVQSGSGSEGAFTPTSNGIYTLSLNAICNGIKCEPCVYTFVVEGCPEAPVKKKTGALYKT